MDRPSYYAVIPAKVRYDTRLTANEKLLYGEITAMCNQEGYCWASNGYFAELYGVSKRTSERWVNNLEECGYIARVMESKYEDERTKEIVRKIYMTDALSGPTPPRQKCRGGSTKMSRGVDKNVDHNNINNNHKEYRYSDPPKKSSKKQSSQFQNFSQREYDYDDLEKALFSTKKLEGDSG